MDVPVPVLGDVGGDRPGDVISVEPLVLVVEDVVSVALQFGRAVPSIGSRSPCSSNAAMSSSRTGRVMWSKTLALVGAGTPSRIARWKAVRGPSYSAQPAAPPWVAIRPRPRGRSEIALATRDLLAAPRRATRTLPVADGDEDQSLTELRDAVSPGFDDPLLDASSRALQLEDDAAEDEHLPVERHIGNVLHDHGPGSARRTISRKDRHRSRRRSCGSRRPCSDEVPHARAAGLRERLARRPAGEDVDVPRRSSPLLARPVGVPEIPVEGEPGEVVPVCFKRFWVMVRAKNDVHSRLFEP